MGQYSQAVIDQRISEPSHDKNVLDELNSVYKTFLMIIKMRLYLPEDITNKPYISPNFPESNEFAGVVE